ncbi:MAG: flagellar protein FlaG [Planctomycetia bacterium]|nr:flagellar protein FlaG [Planctomycetia bacterium]
MNTIMSGFAGAPQPTSFGDVAQLLVSRPEPAQEQARGPAQGPAMAGGEGLQEAVRRANEAAAGRSLDVQFGIHQASGQFWVRVLDPKSGDIVKTVPPEKLLDFRAAVDRSIGLIFDEVA